MSSRPGVLGPAPTHVLTLLLVAALLLLRAQPVNWDTPSNLASQEGWGSLVVVVMTLAGLGGSVEGVLWARGARVAAVAACLLCAAFAFAGAGFYLDGLIANGGEVVTAGREQVVMSQLVWGGVLGFPDAGHGRLAAAARQAAPTHESRPHGRGSGSGVRGLKSGG